MSRRGRVVAVVVVVCALGATALAGKRPHHRHHPRRAARAAEVVEVPPSTRVVTPAPVVAPVVAPTRAARTASTAPAATVAPEPVDSAASDATAEAVDMTARLRPASRPSAFDIGVGAGVYMRRLSFRDDLFSKLHGYQLDAAPTIDLALTWFPGAHLTQRWLAHLGLAFRGSFALVFGSRGSDGVERATTAYGLDAGLVARIPIGRVAQPELAVAYGRQVYEVGGGVASGEKPLVPSVTYSFVRFGAGLRVRAHERVTLDGHAGYRLLVGTGELGTTYFPRARVDAIDADATLTVALYRGLEARLGGAVQHYFAKLNPEPGDPLVAGGLTDTHVTGTIALAYRL